jgi:peptidoglycan pentaglycine glycine transferase (the first glycine)
VSEEDLLMGLRKTTRYLVKKAEEAGVEVHRSSSPSMLSKFFRLMEVTKKRQGFVPHSTKYLQTQFETLAKRGMAELSFATYEGDTLSTAVNISYGDTASYVHGASVRGSVPASYALLWENIKECKKDGFSFFDFWGIAPEGASKRHPWYGYSLFKKGFGGYPFEYIGAWDFALTPKYLAVYAADMGRKVIRGV